MIKKKITSFLLVMVILTLTSCSHTQKLDPASKHTSERKNLNPEVENSDNSMKIEGLTFNLKKTLVSSEGAEIEKSSCPIYFAENALVESQNFKVYDVSGESANGSYIVPQKIAFCDLNFESEKYVLILASYTNGNDINDAVKAAFDGQADAFLYLGLPTGLTVKQKIKLQNLEIYDGSVSTDDCLPDSAEFSDTECPTGLASYFRVNNFLVILSQRVVKGYTPSSLEKYSTKNILGMLY